ncbi:hypothetical protein Q361_103154 [Flavobacterium croceum DSM 17960]|uniref:Uncharacterized protein n=1 Tax=Flavobacterium croceum DSM 17960 TaxID=1121886 RepID=A0A2S4NAB2_9FLAO|nr:hypothetical protein [Flavobacterium croceum]POS02639.1 hypothetical protein Q361_103154 [Flavobacterium croceum DSM 17960]
MRKKIFLVLLFQFLLSLNLSSFAQTMPNADADKTIKDQLYKKYRREVLAFDRKKYDDLFFEYIRKTGESTILTKEQYYTYTIKISIYAEKLGLLYRDQKEESLKTKQVWYDKSYSDYLKSKNKK